MSLVKRIVLAIAKFFRDPNKTAYHKPSRTWYDPKKQVFLDPNKVEYDGYGFKVVFKNQKEFKNKMKKLQKEVDADIKATGGPQ